MTNEANRRELALILEDLADGLDVPASKYREAKEHYEAVGGWLGAEGSNLALLNLIIHPQGSFALGTAIKPLGEDDYDVDAVCLLQASETSVSQQQLKDLVGQRLLQPGSPYRNMLDPREGGRRCWTIKYADASKFHLDVLPAIPDAYDWLLSIGVEEQFARHAICITDRETWDKSVAWPRSNPKGYAEWFKGQMRVRLEEGRQILATARKADVQEIEDFEVRTPLQRVVQLLKRHRDLRYNGDEDKPVSIIITTLAAQAYDNQADLLNAILDVVPQMRAGIQRRNGEYWVPNPVNPEENFADKWAESPRKQRLFFEWLDAIEREHTRLVADRGMTKTGEYLAESYGHRDAAETMTKSVKRRAQTGRGTGPMILVPPKRNGDRGNDAPRDIHSQPSKPWCR